MNAQWIPERIYAFGNNNFLFTVIMNIILFFLREHYSDSWSLLSRYISYAFWWKVKNWVKKLVTGETHYYLLAFPVLSSWGTKYCIILCDSTKFLFYRHSTHSNFHLVHEIACHCRGRRIWCSLWKYVRAT